MNLQELKESLFDAEDMTQIYAKIKCWADHGEEESKSQCLLMVVPVNKIKGVE